MTVPAPAEVAVVPSWWGARVGGLPRTFWALWSGTLANRLGSFVLPFLSLFLTRGRGYSVSEAGAVLTAFGLGSAVSQPIGGMLADRIGRRRTMVGSLASSAAALVALGASHHLPALCVTAFVFGVTSEMYRPASSASVADLVPQEQRARAFALLFWALNLGFAVATLLGGYLADKGYWLLFGGDAATSLVFAGVVLRLVPETMPPRRDSPGSFGAVVRDRLMLALVLSVILEAVAYMQAFYTLPLAVVHDGLGTGGYGIVIALNGVLIVALQPLLLGALGRRSRGPLLLTSGVVIGVGLWLTSFADTVPMHMLAVGVWTIGEILGAGQLGALVASIAPPHLRGRYMGLFGMSYGVSAFLAPGLGTQVLAHLGENALWRGCLVLACTSGVVMLLVSHAADRRTS
ncbi:MAG: putative arabinose efflux permease, family [Frankiales bacterium]|nr:putative arabinose efflux permease, family [Frankiales bacterium]